LVNQSGPRIDVTRLYFSNQSKIGCQKLNILHLVGLILYLGSAIDLDITKSLPRKNMREEMSKLVIPAPEVHTIPTADGGAFPVRRVYCIGRNFAAHAVEMGHDPDREPPFFFQKNPNNLDASGEFPYPPHSKDVHHEIELLVALKSGGSNIPLESALDHVWGYGVTLDMTRRDLQGEAKKTGRPWEIGKAFERSGPVGPVLPVSEVGHPDKGRVDLKVQ
jgi:fumarylpyruvate hydrolase